MISMYLDFIGRNHNLFSSDISKNDVDLCAEISSSSFLVIGGGGSIGQAVTKEIFKRNPKVLHVVDINENDLVELVRDVRSHYGYINGEFMTYAIDCGGIEFNALMKSGVSYDYILNLSALKHVRSEKDPFTLMRMIEVNILNTLKTLELAKEMGVKKYFCVSTDKAANPVNMMGASKRIMELFLKSEASDISITMARFANVAFSNGSLLDGFNNRVSKGQPISAPTDVLRYFITQEEAGQICLLSCIFGNNYEIFVPKVNDRLKPISFSDICERYLQFRGFNPYYCNSEIEARNFFSGDHKPNYWPVYFFESDTTGEKSIEEFFTASEIVDKTRFHDLGVITYTDKPDGNRLNTFKQSIDTMRSNQKWDRGMLINLFKSVLDDFNHFEKGKFLDDKM